MSKQEEPLVAYGESIGPPLTWHRPTLGIWRQQCDDDKLLERNGLDDTYAELEIGEDPAAWGT